jgi:ADP-ribosylglycohydrolase
MEKLSLDHYVGCILGGAVGDALGAPIEFMALDKITSLFGDDGVNDYVEFKDGIGRITDDTQMTLFTIEGLLRALHRYSLKGIGGAHVSLVYHSYKRWLYTQDSVFTGAWPKELDGGWLLGEELLYKKRFPGSTCIQALGSGVCGSVENPINSSKGCGGIMRVAPVGLIIPDDAFEVGAELAAITHGHPSGYLSAGAFSSIMALINKGDSLIDAIEKTVLVLRKWEGHEETLLAIQKAVDLFNDKTVSPSPQAVEMLGGAWTGEEALSISLYCSLAYQDNFKKAIHLAVNHGGDSDSTGSITGNIVGLLLGAQSIPKAWIEKLELSGLIVQMAKDAYESMEGINADMFSNEWRQKYTPF